MLLLRKVFNFTCEKQVVIRNHVLINQPLACKCQSSRYYVIKKIYNPYFESDCINNEKLIHGTPCAVKAACTVWTGAKGSKESDLSVLLFRYEYSSNFFYKLWKRIRKYNGLITGLTQNVDELLRSDTRG